MLAYMLYYLNKLNLKIRILSPLKSTSIYQRTAQEYTTISTNVLINAMYLPPETAFGGVFPVKSDEKSEQSN